MIDNFNYVVLQLIWLIIIAVTLNSTLYEWYLGIEFLFKLRSSYIDFFVIYGYVINMFWFAGN